MIKVETSADLVSNVFCGGLMKYRKGERVQHPVKLDWGIGEVFADCAGNVLNVFFSNAGEKSISLSLACSARESLWRYCCQRHPR